MRTIVGCLVVGGSLIAATALPTSLPAAATPMMLAQLDKEPPKLPEVTPGLDNPNNPAIPGNDEKGKRSDRPQTPPSGATSEGRSQCGTLTDTMARRRCLEEMQRRND